MVLATFFDIYCKSLHTHNMSEYSCDFQKDLGHTCATHLWMVNHIQRLHYICCIYKACEHAWLYTGLYIVLTMALWGVYTSSIWNRPLRVSFIYMYYCSLHVIARMLLAFDTRAMCVLPLSSTVHCTCKYEEVMSNLCSLLWVPNWPQECTQ